MDKHRDERPVIHTSYPTFEVGGVIYDEAKVLEHRELIIQMRNHALEQSAMDWSVYLSHTIGILAHLATMLKATVETKQ